MLVNFRCDVLLLAMMVTWAMPPQAQCSYLFTSFRGSGDGLHLASSEDGRHWKELPGVWLKPTVGSGLMRDPHITRGPDDTFHMVWTSGWGDKGIGYASSKDLVSWSAQKYLPLMEHEPATRTCWAPEVYYLDEEDQFMIVWSSSVPPAAPEGAGQGGYHRAYYVLTKDFADFTPPKMLFDPGFNNIDTTMVKVGDRYRIVFKETDDQPARRWGRVCAAEAPSPTGPYKLLEEPIIQNERVEGPALLQTDDQTLLFVDYYGDHRYGGLSTTDWSEWSRSSGQYEFVDGQRHGSILRVSQEELTSLSSDAGREAPPAVLPGVNADPHIAFFGDRAYIYPTTDGSVGWRSDAFHTWSSADLVNWRDEGQILSLPDDLTWADVHAWAPAIATKNGKYYYYYSADKNVGVAVADRPEGPFRDPLGKPLVSARDFRKMQCIDPMVFVDDDGSAYLYWGQGRCKAVKLNDDMVSFDHDAVRDITPRGYNEGPFVHKRNGKYYLSWSEYDTRDPRYSVAYGMADSPLGPFTKAEQNPILKQRGVIHGAGHHSIGKLPGRDEWVVAYHRFQIPDGDGYHRETCLSPLRFNEDGTIQAVDVFEPMGAVNLAAAAQTSDSELADPDAVVRIDLAQAAKPISKDLFGIFFEDLNYAADGGLYAELIENRSFEYSAADHPSWNELKNWELIQRDGGRGAVVVEANQPLHSNNPHYAVLSVIRGEAGLRCEGFHGLPVQEGKKYDFSLFARQLSGAGGALIVRIESADGEILAEAHLGEPAGHWGQLGAVLKPTATATDARLTVISKGVGRVALDMISLFPQETFRGRKNGLRRDLAQVIADLAPKFVRFPGGCLVHGDGLDNMYRWKDSIGPVHQRKGQRNIWKYHQSLGLGYLEYFQFCEDIGAKPVPVVPAGVCCQNAGASITGLWGQGQRGIPLAQMPVYVQEVLDLIEYANGSADSEWGRKRAEAGHPEPFGLEYLGVGNEDHITPEFEERFRIIHAAVTARHPAITVIGTVGPSSEGRDYDEGWRIANQLQVAMVDEHYYRSPQWFFDNLERYDSYNRGRSTVYLGEYAAHDRGRTTTLRSALAEAAYMTHLERNGDVVRLASYAPLLGKVGHTQWNPNLIYFTNTDVRPTISYYVQQMFSVGSGDAYLDAESPLPMSVVRDSESGDTIIKLVNKGDEPKQLRFDLTGDDDIASKAACTVLSGSERQMNRSDRGGRFRPRESTIDVGGSFDYTAPARSLSVIRLMPRGGA